MNNARRTRTAQSNGTALSAANLRILRNTFKSTVQLEQFIEVYYDRDLKREDDDYRVIWFLGAASDRLELAVSDITTGIKKYDEWREHEVRRT